ncbi:hypothetical protein BH11MYX3_BH11MYX3_43770 [soil metagenome]
MRTLQTFAFALVVALTACAGSNAGAHGPVNVAAVRHQINDTIQDQAHDRSVTSMGKVSADHAVVFTTSKAGVRAEESWTKDASGWRLETASPLDGTGATTANAN